MKEKIQIKYKEELIGEFIDEFILLKIGSYKYMPFRNHGHYLFATDLKNNSIVNCSCVINNSRFEFMVNCTVEENTINIVGIK